MSKRDNLKALLIVAAVGVLFGIATTVTFSWFSTSVPVEHTPVPGSSIANYFASGDGSQEKPYILNKPQHVYNLAWLQNLGVFNRAGSDGKIPTTYFELGADIDMDASDTTIHGAVPPIGSDTYPFVGYFDGMKHTISNLWVSSDPADWIEQPATQPPIGDDIGMFGVIQKNENGVTYVGNYFLENVEVTTDLISSDSRVGIASGYLDASMSKVGVINGKISMKHGAGAVSQFSLIGETSQFVIWKDSPVPGGSGGGDLTIQPMNNTNPNDKYYIGNAFTLDSSKNGSLNGKVSVPGSLNGTAYFYGDLSISSADVKSTQKYTGSISFGSVSFSNGIATINPASGAIDSAFSTDDKDEKSFTSYYETYHSTPKKMIVGKPVLTNGSAPSLSECIWFKPQGTGTCALAFFHENQGTQEKMALYRYKLKNGKVDGLQEIQFVLSKAFGNKCVAYFEIDLSDADVGDYEYVIGLASSQAATTNAGFFYMMLAGSDESGGVAENGTGKVLEKIDFLPVLSDSDKTIWTFSTLHLPFVSINEDFPTVVSGALQNFLYRVDDTDHYMHYFTDGNLLPKEVSYPTIPSSTKDSTNAAFTPINNPVTLSP